MTNSKATSSVMHRDIHSVPKHAVDAEGSYIFLEDGQKLLDSASGLAVSCIGHRNKEVIAAMKKQLDQLAYCNPLSLGTDIFEELATFMTESTGGQMSKLFVVSSGSEANEAAMKLARQYFLELPTPEPQRTRFIARKNSYHGATLGSLSLSGHAARRALFEPLLLPNVSHVSPCYSYRDQRDYESDAQYVARLADELDEEFQKVGPETVCAFFAEPVVGAALGCVPAVNGYFPAMKTVCDKYGALLILDEVMSGIGRSGTLHAWEQEDVVPDIQTIGKGFGGGYAPASGVLISKKVVNTLDKGTGMFQHLQTYQGHPIACAAALAVQKVIKDQNLLQNVREMGALLGIKLKEYIGDHPNVGDVRGRGLFWGIELVKDKTTKEPFDPKLRVSSRIQETAMSPKYSFSIYPGGGTKDGRNGDHVILAPPYNVNEGDIDTLARLTAAVIKDVFKDLS